MKFKLFGVTWSHWRLLALIYGVFMFVLLLPFIAISLVDLLIEKAHQRFDPFRPGRRLLNKHFEYVA